MTKELRRQLGLVAVMAVVAGDMMGSGIFYTPQELASVFNSGAVLMGPHLKGQWRDPHW